MEPITVSTGQLLLTISLSYVIVFAVYYLVKAVFQVIYTVLYALFSPLDDSWSHSLLECIVNHIEARIFPDLFFERISGIIKDTNFLSPLYSCGGYQCFKRIQRPVSGYLLYLYKVDRNKLSEIINNLYELIYSAAELFPDDRRIGDADPVKVLDQFVDRLAGLLRHLTYLKVVETIGYCPKKLLGRLDPVGKEELRELVMSSFLVSVRVKYLGNEEGKQCGNSTNEEVMPN